MTDLTVHRYGWSLQAQEAIAIPHGNPGNNLRGAFGLALKRLVCVDWNGCRMRCRQPECCPYAQMLETGPPQESAKLSRYQDVPRPFVLKPPTGMRQRYAPGETLDFGLVLAGDRKRYLPYAAVTFKALEEEGLGASRGRFRLKDVVSLDAAGNARHTVYDWQTGTFHDVDDPVRLKDFQSEGPIRELELEFRTPIYLKADGKIVDTRSFEFHHLAKRLRDRISGLSYFYGGGSELDIDHRQFGVVAEQVRCMERQLTWFDARRKSSRTGRWHELGGLVGRVRFGGDLTMFYPYLKLGELVHCGKYATFGQGEIRVHV